MANTLLTISMITNEALMVLKNNLQFTRYVNRSYDDKFAVAGAKIGATLNIRKPARYVGRRGQAMQIEDITESYVPLTLNNQYGCDVTFSTADMALSIDLFRERILVPQLATVANMIDSDGMNLYKQIYNSVGTPATVPTDDETYLNAGVKLDNTGTPRDGNRSVVFGAQMQATLVHGLRGLFQSATKIREQYEDGEMGTALGFKFSMDQNTATHTVGTQGGVPLVNGANQTGASIITDGWTGAVATRLNEGDVFTLAGVYAVNPQSRQSTGQLQQFVTTADAASDVNGNITIPISPSIIIGGAFQTVTASPADNAALTVVGASAAVSPQGLAFHRDAFCFATADLPLPGGVDKAARISDPDLGISIRMVRAYSIENDQLPCRLDILGGWTVLRPELACRIMS